MKKLTLIIAILLSSITVLAATPPETVTPNFDTDKFYFWSELHQDVRTETLADRDLRYILRNEIGTDAGELVQLDSSGRLPAVDGSLLIGVPSVDDVLPSQAGYAGYFLTTDGTTPYWVSSAGLGDMLQGIYDTNTNNIVDASESLSGTSGVNSSTATEVRTHLDNTAAHRLINDSGATTTDLYSASKINTLVDAKLSKTSNLSDLTSAATARSNLGLGNASTRNVGTTSATVAQGDAPNNAITAHTSSYDHSQLHGHDNKTLLDKLPDDTAATSGQVMTKQGDGSILWQDQSGTGTATFGSLSDTPSDFTGQAGKYLVVNSGETAIEYTDPPSGGSQTFSGLTDTPGDYTVYSGMVPAVNATTDGLEYITVLKPSNNLSDLNSASSARTNLGLGNSATLSVGTTAGTVAAGNHVQTVAAGGTGATDAATARSNLGVVIGTNVQAYDADLDDLADGSLSGSKVGTGISGTNITTGTVADARIASTIARDSEIPTAVSELTNDAGYTTVTASTDLSDTADLVRQSDIGTAADNAEGDFATAAQGALADSAVQPGDNMSDLVNDSGYLLSESQTAADVPFDDTTAQLGATDTQSAVDAVDSRVDTIESAGYLTTESDPGVTTHEDAIDPHTGYMLEDNIGTGAGNFIQLDVNGDLPFAIGVDATGFNGNLTTADDTLQKVAQAVDDLTVSGSPAIADITDWPAAVSATEVGYLDGVTSSLQAQIDALSGGNLSVTEQASDPVAGDLSDGDVVVSIASGDLFIGSATGMYTFAGTYTANPTTYSLTVDVTYFTGADKFTYDSTDYTTDQTFSGLNADASFTVTPDFGRSISCTGAGLTDNGSGSYTANTDSADITAFCTSSAASSYLAYWSMDSTTVEAPSQTAILSGGAEIVGSGGQINGFVQTVDEYQAYAELTLGSGDIVESGGTLEIYVRWPTAAAGSTRRLLRTSGGDSNISCHLDASGYVYFYVGSDYVISDTALTADTWTKIEFTWDGSNHSITINDGTPTQESLATTITTDITSIQLGGRDSDNSYLDVDEFYVY